MTEKNKSINQIIDFRKEKLNKLKELGINPYPHKFSPSHKSIEILDGFNNLDNKIRKEYLLSEIIFMKPYNENLEDFIKKIIKSNLLI